MAHYKSPRHLRLMRIEEWAEQRLERRKEAHDTAAGIRAALFYQTVSGLLYRDALSEVTSFREYGAKTDRL
jgi:hypothetical protein